MKNDIPVTLISGYLGAGKTTILNHLLSLNTGLRIAVLVNDFGRINVDAGLVRNMSGDTIELTNGCVCCSIGDDLGTALSDQARRSDPPDHVLVEASGVTDPDRVATLSGCWPGFKLDSVIVAADAETIKSRAGDKYVGRLIDTQLRAADVIALTKCDLVAAAELEPLSGWLSAINSGASIVETPHGRLPPEIALGHLDRFSRDLTRLPDRQEPPVFRSRLWYPDAPVDTDRLIAVLSKLPSQVHRVKGVVCDAKNDRPMLVQSVGARVSITPASNVQHCCLTIIAAGQDLSPVEKTCERLTECCLRKVTAEGALSESAEGRSDGYGAQR